MEELMPEAYSNKKIVQELKKEFASEAKSVRIEMKHSHEVGLFLQKLDSAHESASKSELVFK